MFVEIAVLWRTLRKNNEIKQVNLHNQEIKFTSLTLKQDIWKKTVHSQSFLKTKDSQVSFCKRANKIQVFNYTVIENFKTICPYLNSGETALKLMSCHWSVYKTTWKPFFFFRKRCDRTVYFQLSWLECPHCKLLNSLDETNVSLLKVTCPFDLLYSWIDEKKWKAATLSKIRLLQSTT